MYVVRAPDLGHAVGRQGGKDKRRAGPQVADLDGRVLGAVGPPRQGPHAGQEFLEGERFHEVIVGPEVEPADSVRHGVFGRQDQDVRGPALGPQAAEDRQAVHFRKHQVQDDHVVVVVGGVPQPLFAVARHVERKAGLAQAL